MINLDILAQKMELRHICGSTDREICGCYAGDLLSWVMSHAEYGHIWITIMSNINVVAVASLCDVACVVLAEGVELDPDALEAATKQDICVFSSKLSTYELCTLVSKYINE
ncbi:MAG: AraC family transcriptional regulator [Clostridia bacterium]|nr:AraC family transcriptional regulator [Clostridia bacterium]MBR6650439.1 AraC family transcriptional regulator [Clostridia bacterium]